MVFYRLYRPQKIEELDNSSVRESLLTIFSKENYPHAFLFTGPKGLGKTSAARIVAKVINCEKHKGLKGKRTEKDIEPDNKCQQCISITNGNNLDVLEIDGASNRGIDEIRDLREKIKLSPFKASKKIYIIDEVHMLTTEAFNALLKTLEEPPGHAVFILCTTELQKVPETIVSRCFRINFTKATDEELARSLSRIVRKEEIKIDKEALLEISKLSDGSFRDAAKILEEVFSFSGRKTITKELVDQKYNTKGLDQSLNALLESFSKKDASLGLSTITKLAEQGIDFKFVIERLIDKIHQILLVEVGIEKGQNPFSLNTQDIRKLFYLLSDAYTQTKTAVLAQVPLELVLLEWSQEMQNVALEKEEETVSTPSISNDFFSNLINEVKVQNHLVAGVLRSCIGENKNGTLTIFAKSKFHKEKLEDLKTIQLITDSAGKVLGKKVKVSIMLREVS